MPKKRNQTRSNRNRQQSLVAKPNQRKWWQRPLSWAAGIGGALVVAAATSFGTGVGQRLFSASEPHSASHTQSLKVSEEIRNSAAYETAGSQAWALPYVLDPASSVASLALPQTSSSGYATPDSYIDRFDSWLFSRGGASVGVTDLQLTLTGGSGTTIVQGICAEIVSRTKIMNGTLFFEPPQGGEGSIETALDLDAAEPCAKYFNGHYITLSQGEGAVVNIHVVAHSDTVTWELFLDAVVNGKHQYIPVNSKETLRTTGLLSSVKSYGIYYKDTQTENFSEEFRPTVPDSSDNTEVEALPH
jgi:hypothetical protein